MATFLAAGWYRKWTLRAVRQQRVAHRPVGEAAHAASPHRQRAAHRAGDVRGQVAERAQRLLEEPIVTFDDLAARASAVGFVPKGDLIWYQAGTRLRPYGYPKVFVPNIAHQHILVLRKEAARR